MSLYDLDKGPQMLAALLENYAAETLRPVLADLNSAANLTLQMKQIEDNPYKHLRLPMKIKKPIECYDDN